MTYNEGSGFTVGEMRIDSDGDLWAFYYDEVGNMAKVNLGHVVGAKGDTGAKGETGATGAQGIPGPKGEQCLQGISPTFSIDANGDLYADYDNPYNPNTPSG